MGFLSTQEGNVWPSAQHGVSNPKWLLQAFRARLFRHHSDSSPRYNKRRINPSRDRRKYPILFWLGSHTLGLVRGAVLPYQGWVVWSWVLDPLRRVLRWMATSVSLFGLLRDIWAYQGHPQHVPACLPKDNKIFPKAQWWNITNRISFCQRQCRTNKLSFVSQDPRSVC